MGRCPDAQAAKKRGAAGAKRKAEEAEKLAATAVSSEAGKPATASADPSCGLYEEEASIEKWVELPIRYVRWVLAQKRENYPIAAPSIEDYEICPSDPMQKIVNESLDHFTRLSVSLKKSRDEFFQYQDWMRKVFERNSRVMVPESVMRPRPELQEEINNLWAQFSEEYDRENPDSDTEDGED